MVEPVERLVLADLVPRSKTAKIAKAVESRMALTRFSPIPLASVRSAKSRLGTFRPYKPPVRRDYEEKRPICPATARRRPPILTSGKNDPAVTERPGKIRQSKDS